MSSGYCRTRTRSDTCGRASRHEAFIACTGRGRVTERATAGCAGVGRNTRPTAWSGRRWSADSRGRRERLDHRPPMPDEPRYGVLYARTRAAFIAWHKYAGTLGTRAAGDRRGAGRIRGRVVRRHRQASGGAADGRPRRAAADAGHVRGAHGQTPRPLLVADAVHHRRELARQRRRRGGQHAGVRPGPRTARS